MPTDADALALLLEPYHGTDRLVIPTQAVASVEAAAEDPVLRLADMALSPLLWDGDQA